MENIIKKWLNFDEMVTPKIITIIYWLLLASIIIAGIFFIFFSPLRGLFILFGGIVGLRIYFELIILFFKIYEQVKRIADNLDNKSGQIDIDKPVAPQQFFTPE